MSNVTLSATPNPPTEYTFWTDASNLTVPELRQLLASVDSIESTGRDLSDFKLVNGGKGKHVLRKRQ